MWLITVFSSITTLAGQYRITNYNHTHGLPITSISAFAEDSLGYIWMGSNNGLVRFDGFEFKYYEPSFGDTTSIYGSEVADITVGQDGKVWISFHDGGLSVYDHNTGGFKSRYKRDSDTTNFPTTAILNLLIDNKSDIVWGVGSEGVFSLDMNTMKSVKVADVIKGQDILQDPNDENFLYLGTSSTLWHVNKLNHEKIKVIDYGFNSLEIDGDVLFGHDWSKNVKSYNIVSKEVKIFPTTDNWINRGVISKDDKYWLSTYGGIIEFDKTTGTRFFINKGNLLSGIESDHIYGIYNDSRNRVWMGTDKGVSVILPEYQLLKDFRSAGAIRYSDIISAGLPGKYFAASLYDNELAEIDIDLGKVEKINIQKYGDNIGPTRLIKDGERVWILGFNGLWYFTSNDRRIRKFDAGIYNNMVHSQDIGDMVMDNVKRIWISRNSINALISISPDRTEIDTITLEQLKPGDKVKNLHYDGKALWIGTESGLCRLDPESGKVSWFMEDNPRYQQFIYAIEDVNTDLEGNLWVLSTQNGAWKCKYDEKSDDLTILKGYHQSDGLANNRPWNVEVDDNGTLYFGSTSGLSIYNKENDRMVSYGIEYGFGLLSLNCRYLEGKLFILSRGLSYFNVEELSRENEMPSLNFRSIIVNGKRISEKHEDESHEISIFSHKENDFVFEYAAVEFDRPKDLNYRYRINQEENWTIVDYFGRMAVYNDLQPGSYTFEVSVAGKNLVWSSPKSYSFKINPPYWATWWFKGLMAAIVGVCVWLFIRWRERQIKLIGDMRNRMTELENEALRAQMNPHFVFNSLNSIKSFIITNRKEEAADYLTTFAELIRTVLRNSRSQNIPLSEEIKALNLYMEIENIRLEDRFDVEWDIDQDVNIDAVLVPPLTLQPFVENAIWHGFIHKEGRGKLKLSVRREEQHLAVEIEDNGIGREKSKEIEKKHFRKRSFGIAITQQRLGYKDRTRNNIEIKDLYDGNGKGCGTIVRLSIPYKILGKDTIISSK